MRNVTDTIQRMRTAQRWEDELLETLPHSKINVFNKNTPKYSIIRTGTLFNSPDSMINKTMLLISSTALMFVMS